MGADIPSAIAKAWESGAEITGMKMGDFVLFADSGRVVIRKRKSRTASTIEWAGDGLVEGIAELLRLGAQRP